jgi:hypothetical protein
MCPDWFAIMYPVGTSSFIASAATHSHPASSGQDEKRRRIADTAHG